MEDKLNSKAYQTVSQRMATEEATCAFNSSSMPYDDELNGASTSGCGVGDEEQGNKRSNTNSANLIEQLSEDGNYVSNISNVTNVVVGRVGNMFGKSIGGITSKLGSGGWF